MMSASQETSSKMTLGEYMRWPRHNEVLAPHMISEESPLMIYEKYYKHIPLSLEQRLRVLACQELYADDDLEELVYLEDIIVESNDLETIDIHNEVASSNLNCEIPIGHLAADDNESIIHDIVAPLSPCFVDSSYDFLIADVNAGAVGTGQVTDDFEQISVCLAHFADSDDPMLIDIVNALCPAMVNHGNSTTEVISADLEPDLGVNDFDKLEPLDTGLSCCAEFDNSLAFHIVDTLLPMISSEDNVSTECISADLEPDLAYASRIETNIHYMFVVHESDLFISTNDFFLLGIDLHIFLEVYSVCRFIFAANLICWIDPQIFRLYIYALQLTLVYHHLV
ncbi:uncharacterized protein LOC113303081 [Papaver somniferum]|uniref:uncharacterized protein LOC113303081 n=1 Tax=Papaver somniferum TaxID=3469 RepID=UPI000E705C2D|nr:uncharacterized protein LOC113303081 [Papaver somniferum]XP_026407858.1 uncharacterized protein LOC113303081 [Papaver somniferum]